MVFISAKVKGFNKYKIEGDTTILYLERRSGDVIEALIDTEDLERLIQLNYRWCARYAKNTGSYYVQVAISFGEKGHRKQNTYHLNTIIMNCPKGQKVDHINHNTLDNRKENLRICSSSNNSKNRKGKSSNNTSGYRNVSWDKKMHSWMVQLQVNGKNKILKRFPYEELDKAGEYAEQMRKEIYGEYAGYN